MTPIRRGHLDSLKGVLERIDGEARQSNAIIDILLVNVRAPDGTARTLETCSIAVCVETALERCPFSDDERALVHWKKGDDFVFRGIELLTVHLLFNLIKNALRHIGTNGRGEISIRVDTLAGHHLVVRDTAGGIAPEVLPHIFERFYTAGGDGGVLGTGIGLAFCRDVMRSFGGDIVCTSELGEYTQFTLTFPSA